MKRRCSDGYQGTPLHNARISCLLHFVWKPFHSKNADSLTRIYQARRNTGAEATFPAPGWPHGKRAIHYARLVHGLQEPPRPMSPPRRGAACRAPLRLDKRVVPAIFYRILLIFHPPFSLTSVKLALPDWPLPNTRETVPEAEAPLSFTLLTVH